MVSMYWERLVPRWWRQWWCGRRGHALTLVYEPDRLGLRCLSCEYESPGWMVGTTAQVPESRCR